MSVPLQRLSASQAYRQSLETTAFESEHDWPIDLTQWGVITTGGGNITRNAAISALVVAVSSASGDVATLRSHARPRAAANRSSSFVVALHCSNSGETSQHRLWGRFDENNGLFFRLNGEDLSCVRRSNTSGTVVEVETLRPQWSEVKTAIDVTKTHVWEAREVWPNGDIIFLVDGQPVHRMDTDGNVVGPGFKTARLPLTVQVRNASSAAIGSVSVVSASMSVEGVPPSKTFGVDVDATGITAAQVLFSIRPALLFGSQANLGELLADTLTGVCSDTCRFRWVLGGTVSGGTWAAHADANSFAELNTTATSVSGGRSFAYAVDGGVSDSGLAALLPALRVQADGTTQDTLTLTAESISGAAITASASLAWKETR